MDGDRMPGDPADDAEASAHVLTPAPPGQKSAVKRMEALAQAVPPAADLVLLGDSLAAGWPPASLAEAAPGWCAFNFGLPGDRIQNTLWRLREGAVAHLRPRRAMVVLGTNNLGDGDPPDAILRGLEEVAAVARRLWGEPDVIVVTVPWRDLEGREADRRRLNAALIETLAPLPWARVIDADRWLGVGTGALVHLERDRVHINAAGYSRLGAALRQHPGR